MKAPGKRHDATEILQGPSDSGLLDDAIYVYDVKSQKIIGRVTVGSGPNWVAFSPDGKYVCVSNAAADVSIIDVNPRREVARLKVGRVPKRLVAASVPNGDLASQSASRWKCSG